MRYTEQPKTRINTVDGGRSHAALFERVEAEVPDGARRAGAIVLVGGADHRSGVLRRTQAAVRFDQRASRWSHAAVIADWSGSYKDALGLEASFDPSDPSRQVPERNGVTSFALTRYLDRRRYPNLCVATLEFPDEAPGADPPTARKKLLEAMRDPNLHRATFPVYQLFGTWSRFLFEPHERSPLLDGVPMPSALYLVSLFVEAGVDLLPSATAPNACPEHIWASLLRWMPGQGVTPHVWIAEDERRVDRTPLPSNFKKEIPSLYLDPPTAGRSGEA